MTIRVYTASSSFRTVGFGFSGPLRFCLPLHPKASATQVTMSSSSKGRRGFLLWKLGRLRVELEVLHWRSQSRRPRCVRLHRERSRLGLNAPLVVRRASHVIQRSLGRCKSPGCSFAKVRLGIGDGAPSLVASTCLMSETAYASSRMIALPF